MNWLAKFHPDYLEVAYNERCLGPSEGDREIIWGHPSSNHTSSMAAYCPPDKSEAIKLRTQDLICFILSVISILTYASHILPSSALTMFPFFFQPTLQFHGFMPLFVLFSHLEYLFLL